MTILEQVLNFFISDASADVPVTAAANPSNANSFSSMMVVMGLFVFFIYFTVWRPQSKRAKEIRDLLGSLAKGDEVVTTGGVIGKIAKLADSYVVLSIADNVDIAIQKSSIANVLPKGTLKSI